MSRLLIKLSPIIAILLSSSKVFCTALKPEDTDFLRKQEIIYQLLWNTKRKPNDHPEIYERIKNYHVEDLVAACDDNNQTCGNKQFVTRLKSNKLLSRNGAFSDYRDERIDELRDIYEIFRNARTFDDFVVNAAWISLRVNELIWFYAFGVALARRDDCRYIRMPNLHEIVPNYFYGADVVLRAYRIKVGEVAANGINEQWIIDANNNNDNTTNDNDDDESKLLSYFLTDVGLNEFYYHFTINCPYWMRGDDCDYHYQTVKKKKISIRGEFRDFVHNQLLARYKLERLSCGMKADIEDIDWEQPIITGYRSSMAHLNGQLFPERQSGAKIPADEYELLEQTHHYVARIAKTVDLNEILRASTTRRNADDNNEDNPTIRFNDFCNALEGNADSPHPKYYGSLERSYRRILGFSTNGIPSALELSLTNLRDPGFFRLVNKLTGETARFKRNDLPMYDNRGNKKIINDGALGFDGVRFDYVNVERRLATCAKNYEATLNHPRVVELDDNVEVNAAAAAAIRVKVRQSRLTNKPFVVQIGVSSESEVRGIVRMFLGPVGRNNDWRNFYELDRWIVELKQGNNKLERNSAESIYTSPEIPSSETYWHSLYLGLKTNDESIIRNVLDQKLRRALPRRLLLPRGNKAGLPVRLLVCVHSVDNLAKLPDNAVFGGMPLDGRSLRFPIDRPINDFEGLRNFMVKEVVIYHEEADTAGD